MANKKILSIEIEEKLIKISYLSQKEEKVYLIKKLIIDTPSDSFENGNIINEILISNKIITKLKTKRIRERKVRLIISNSEIVTREAKIPYINKKDINSFVGFNIKEYFHFDISEYNIAYILLDTGIEEMEHKVMLIAVPSRIYKSYYDIMKKCNFKVESIDYRPFYIARFIKNRYRSRDFVAVEISEIKINIVTVNNNRVSYNKTKINELGNNEDFLFISLVNEIINCIQNSLIKDEAKILYIIGEETVANRLIDYINQRVNIQIIIINEAVSYEEIDINNDGLRFINKRSENIMNNVFVKYISISLICTSIFFVIFFLKICEIENDSEMLERKVSSYSNINGSEAEYREKVNNLNELEDIIKIRITSTDKILEILNYIETNFPGNFKILSVSCEENKIYFKGSTDSILIIGKSIELLEKENLYSNIFVPVINESVSDDYKIYEFTIECTLTQVKEDEI